jgi:hypothetical protein
LPEKREEDLGKIKIDERSASDDEKIRAEEEEEMEIAKGGEMMELANVVEESEEDVPVLAAGEGIASEDLE